MLGHIVTVLKLRRESVDVPFRCTIENAGNVNIGSGVKIDPGSVIKGGMGRHVSMFIGKNTRIRRNCYLSATHGKVKIGSFSLLAHNCWVGGHGETEIGENTLIGPGVVIVSSNHNLGTTHFPAMDAPEIAGKIRIGSNSWIGANSTVVPGVTIGSSCLVAGGSVVTRDVPDGYMAAGNPASIIREVLPDEDNLYKQANPR